MTPYVQRLLRAALPPPQRPKHREDRLKALAGALQTLALSAWGLGILTPLITAGAIFRPRQVLVSLCTGAVCELISLTLLAYVPYDTEKGV